MKSKALVEVDEQLAELMEAILSRRPSRVATSLAGLGLALSGLVGCGTKPSGPTQPKGPTPTSWTQDAPALQSGKVEKAIAARANSLRAAAKQAQADYQAAMQKIEKLTKKRDAMAYQLHDLMQPGQPQNKQTVTKQKKLRKEIKKLDAQMLKMLSRYHG